MAQKAPSQKSNLSETAKEVNPLLIKMYKELRDEIIGERKEYYDEMEAEYGKIEPIPEALKQENMVNLANKIIRKEATEEEKVDFRIRLARVKSKVFSDPELDNDKKRTIVYNFVRKLQDVVTG
jgi:hypothetical protein